MENVPIPKEDQEEIKRKRFWGAGNLQNGVLAEPGGFRISPDKDGVLKIADPRSEHDGIEAWRFRNQIYKPIAEMIKVLTLIISTILKDKIDLFFMKASSVSQANPYVIWLNNV